MRSDRILLLAPALLALACTGGDDTGDAGPAGQDCDGSGSLVLTDAQNYVFDGNLDIQSQPTAGGGIDLGIDFSDLSVDLQGHALDPTVDIESANVVIFRYLSPEQVEQALATNSLAQTDISLFGGVETLGRTSLSLSEFTLLGNDIDLEQYYDAGYGTWLLTLNSGTTPGVGARMTAFLDPGAGTDSTVSVGNDSTTLTYAVDLQALTPPRATIGSQVSLDWSALTGAGGGGDFDDYPVDRVLVGHYAETAAELESVFLDIELITDELWHFPVTGGSSLTLTSDGSEEGDFPGFSADGSWVLALQCTTCANPAPPFLTIVEVCE